MVRYSPHTLSVSSSLPFSFHNSLSTRTRRIRISLSYLPSPKCNSIKRNNYLRQKLLKTLKSPDLSLPSPQTLQDSNPRKDEIEVPAGVDEIEVPTALSKQEEEEHAVKEIVSPRSPAILKRFGFGSSRLFRNLAWCFVGLFLLETVYNLWVLTSRDVDGSSGDSTGTAGNANRNKNGALGFYGDESEFKKKVSEIRALAKKARAVERNESRSEASSSSASGDDGSDRTDVRKELNRKLLKLQRSFPSRQGKLLQPSISDAEDGNLEFGNEPAISLWNTQNDPMSVGALKNNMSASLRGESDEKNGFLEQSEPPEDVANDDSMEGEESHWLSDEVLKRIVLKVRANEEAGREPYSGLASDEMNYFLALMRKFRRKGPDYAKQWMEKRIDEIDLRNGGTKKSGQEKPSEESMRPDKLIKSVSQRNAYNVVDKIEKSDSENGSFFSNIDNGSCIEEDFQNNSSNVEDSLHRESYAPQIPKGTNIQNEGSLNGIRSKELPTISQLPEDGNQGNVSVSGENNLGSNGSCNSQIQKREVKQPMLHKVKGCRSDVTNDLWWLDLPYVLAIFLHKGSDPEGPGGLYSLKMKSHSGSESCSYTIAFEDRGDASNFCYLLESFFEDLEDFRADVMPLSTKELAVGVKSKGVNVVVVRKGQIKLYAGQPLADVEMSLQSIVE